MNERTVVLSAGIHTCEHLRERREVGTNLVVTVLHRQVSRTCISRETRIDDVVRTSLNAKSAEAPIGPFQPCAIRQQTIYIRKFEAEAW